MARGRIYQRRITNAGNGVGGRVRFKINTYRGGLASHAVLMYEKEPGEYRIEFICLEESRFPVNLREYGKMVNQVECLYILND